MQIGVVGFGIPNRETPVIGSVGKHWSLNTHISDINSILTRKKDSPDRATDLDFSVARQQNYSSRASGEWVTSKTGLRHTL